GDSTRTAESGGQVTWSARARASAVPFVTMKSSAPVRQPQSPARRASCLRNFGWPAGSVYPTTSEASERAFAAIILASFAVGRTSGDEIATPSGITPLELPRENAW